MAEFFDALSEAGLPVRPPDRYIAGEDGTVRD